MILDLLENGASGSKSAFQAAPAMPNAQNMPPAPGQGPPQGGPPPGAPPMDPAMGGAPPPPGAPPQGGPDPMQLLAELGEAMAGAQDMIQQQQVLIQQLQGALAEQQEAFQALAKRQDTVESSVRMFGSAE